MSKHKRVSDIKKKAFFWRTIIRRAIQVLSFILFPGLFISVFSSIKAIYISLINGSFQFEHLLPQILIVAAVIPLTMIMGRFFCGYLCAFGSMQDLIYFLSKKLLKKKPVISERADKVLKLFKYIFLLFIIVFIWTLGTVSIENSLNPWNIFGVYSSVTGWSDLSLLLSAGAALLALIILGSFFIERFFCRYMCPLGAIFALLSKLRLIRVKKASEGCGACRLCTRSCSMGIPLYQNNAIDSGECIDCFVCTGACPKSNIQVSFAGAKMAPLSAVFIATAAMVGIYYAGQMISLNAANASQNEYQFPNNSQMVQGPYTDGTYTGSAKGYRGTTTVQVTVTNGYISVIDVVSTDDDVEFFNLCKNPVISDILDTQSADVSAVSGATYSSYAIMDAVADALDIPIIITQETSQPEETTTENSLAQETVVTNEASPSPSPAATQEAIYTDGVYNGSGTGFRGEITVSVTVSEGKISAIDVLSHEDDRPYMELASGSVIEDILDAQSVEVDAVSGATFSSNGIMEAVANALNADYTNPNSTLPKGGHGKRNN